MKKTAIVLLMAMLCSSAPAQHSFKKTADAEEKARRFTAQMCERLRLDSARAVRILDINRRVSLQMDSLYHLHLPDSLKRQATAGILHERDTLFRQTLSPTQYLQYDEQQREHRNQWKEKNRTGRPAEFIPSIPN